MFLIYCVVITRIQALNVKTNLSEFIFYFLNQVERNSDFPMQSLCPILILTENFHESSSLPLNSS